MSARRPIGSAPRADALWNEVREAAAVVGWEDKDLILGCATSRIMAAAGTSGDDERERIRGLLDRLWAERAEVPFG